jgi:hypothetical protein
MVPSVVSAVKSGAVSPSRIVMSNLLFMSILVPTWLANMNRELVIFKSRL